MKVHILPILKNNYVFVLENDHGGALVVDPGDAPPVIDFLWKNGLNLLGILITHHHWDHVDGVPGLLKHAPVPVWIPANDRQQWPWGENLVHDGEELTIAGFHFSTMTLPGHTLDHIAYFEKSQGWLFSGDVLFGLGCGRLFEGTPAQMYTSLARIKKLPSTTSIYCTHEYTETNLQFTKNLRQGAQAVGIAAASGDKTASAKVQTEPAVEKSTYDTHLAAYEARLRPLREQGQPSIPLILREELVCNPFLNAPDLACFTERRELRNSFVAAHKNPPKGL